MITERTAKVFAEIKHLVPYDIGVYVPTESNDLFMVKKARRKNRTRPTSEMLSIMMERMRLIFQPQGIDDCIDQKIKRLADRLPKTPCGAKMDEKRE